MTEFYTSMKHNVLAGLIVILFATCSAFAQESESNKYTEDTSSLDNIISSLYEVISGEKGQERNWDRFMNLFDSHAKLIPCGKNPEGVVTARHWTPKEYSEHAGPYLMENGFFEKEIHREEQQLGNITHVWSTYESYRSLKDSEPFVRGINSIQLMNDGKRWWVMNIFWTSETPEIPIPKKYLPN